MKLMVGSVFSETLSASPLGGSWPEEEFAKV